MKSCIVIGSNKTQIPELEKVLQKAMVKVTRDRLEGQIEIARWIVHERSMSISSFAREDACECVTI